MLFFMVLLTSCAVPEEKPGGLASHWDEIIEDEEEEEAEEDEEIWDEIEEDTEEDGKDVCEMPCMTLTLIFLFTAIS